MDPPRSSLYHADCLAPGVGMEAVLRPGSVDMVLCDPPFGMTSRNDWDVRLDAKELFRQLEVVTKPDAVVVFFSQGMYTADLMTGPWRKHWRYNMVWKQDKPRGFLNVNHRPLTYHADIVVFSRERGVYNPQMTPTTAKPLPRMKRAKTSVNYGRGEGGESKRAGATDRHPGSILEFPVVSLTGKNRLHPTQKPVELCEYLIRTFSNPGDLVLDFCAGSATTGEAAQRCGRRFVGFERDRAFHTRAMERLGKRKNRDEEEAETTKKKAREEPAGPLTITDMPTEVICMILEADPKAYHDVLARCGNRLLFSVWLDWAQRTEVKLMKEIGYKGKAMPAKPSVDICSMPGQGSIHIGDCELPPGHYYEYIALGKCCWCRKWPTWVGSIMGGYRDT